MITVAILEAQAFANPSVRGDRRTLGSFGVEIGGVTVRRCFLVEDRGNRYVRTPGCQHEDAEVRFSPALNRYLARVVGREIKRQTEAAGGISEGYGLAEEAAPGVPAPLPAFPFGTGVDDHLHRQPENTRARAREEAQ